MRIFESIALLGVVILFAAELPTMAATPYGSVMVYTPTGAFPGEGMYPAPLRLHADDMLVEANPLCRMYCGPDAGHINECEIAAAWIHYGPGSGPGSAFRQLIPTGVSRIFNCGQFRAIAYEWELVEIAPPIESGSGVQEGCYGKWRFHADGFCPNSDSADGLPHTFLISYRARGWGVPISYDFGAGFYLDYFLGLDSTQCYDLPQGFEVGDLRCP